jgi:curved DNA-binding protein
MPGDDGTNMDVKDYYNVLGVSRNADQKEIRRAFRKLARQYHPDVNPGDQAAEDRFKDLNEAYEVLSDPEKREKYDQFGSQWRQYERAGGRPEDFNWNQWQTQQGAGPGGTGYRTVTPEEFEQMFGGGGRGGFSDFFETLFGGAMGGNRGGFDGVGRTQQPRPRPGRDIEHDVQITLEEAFHGTTRPLQYEDGRQIQARIPPGVKTGSRIRLSGQGGGGSGGGAAGDLYLRVEVTPHNHFERDGDDLRVVVPVDLYTAVLGGSIAVQGIDKQVRLNIPSGTANERVFRLNGLGMPKLGNPEERGDLYAIVSIQLPQNLSEREKQLFEELQEMRK